MSLLDRYRAGPDVLLSDKDSRYRFRADHPTRVMGAHPRRRTVLDMGQGVASGLRRVPTMVLVAVGTLAFTPVLATIGATDEQG